MGITVRSLIASITFFTLGGLHAYAFHLAETIFFKYSSTAPDSRCHIYSPYILRNLLIVTNIFTFVTNINFQIKYFQITTIINEYIESVTVNNDMRISQIIRDIQNMSWVFDEINQIRDDSFSRWIISYVFISAFGYFICTILFYSLILNECFYKNFPSEYVSLLITYVFLSWIPVSILFVNVWLHPTLDNLDRKIELYTIFTRFYKNIDNRVKIVLGWGLFGIHIFSWHLLNMANDDNAISTLLNLIVVCGSVVDSINIFGMINYSHAQFDLFVFTVWVGSMILLMSIGFFLRANDNVETNQVVTMIICSNVFSSMGILGIGLCFSCWIVKYIFLLGFVFVIINIDYWNNQTDGKNYMIDDNKWHEQVINYWNLGLFVSNDKLSDFSGVSVDTRTHIETHVNTQIRVTTNEIPIAIVVYNEQNFV